MHRKPFHVMHTYSTFPKSNNLKGSNTKNVYWTIELHLRENIVRTIVEVIRAIKTKK